MAAIQRLASNIKALLSVTKKYQDAGSVGDQSMSSDNAQHGSGSNPTSSGSTPDRRQVEQVDNPYDEQNLAALSDEEFNAKIEESRAALASMRRPIRQSPVTRSGWESNPVPQDGWRSAAASERTIPVERDVRANLGADFYSAARSFESVPQFERNEPRVFERKHDEGRVVASPESPVDVKNLVKIETLLKEFKMKLSSPANFSSWLNEMRKIGKFRRWPDDLLDAYTAQQLLYIDYSLNTRPREEAFLSLTSTVTADVAYLFASVPFGHVEEAMKILRDKYTAVTVLQKQTACRDFGLMSQELLGLDVDAFAAAIKLETAKIRDIGLMMDETVMSATFINGLLPDFHVIKAQLSDETILGNFDLIVSKVSNYAKNTGLSNKKVKAKRVDNMALQLEQKKSQTECHSFRDTGECKYGESCRFKHVVKPKTSPKEKDKECFKCGKTGHWYKECKAKIHPAVKPFKKNAVAAVTEKEDDDDSDKEQSKDKGINYNLPFLLSASSDHSKNVFGIDSFASSHLTNDRNDFIDGSIRSVKIDFTIGSGGEITVCEQGDVLISQGTSGHTIKLSNVGFFPGLPFKLISGGRLFEAGFQIEHSKRPSKMNICKDGVKVLKACVRNNVLIVEDVTILSKKGSCMAAKSQGVEGEVKEKGADKSVPFPKKVFEESQPLDQSSKRDVIPAESFLELKIQSQKNLIFNVLAADISSSKATDNVLNDDDDEECTLLEEGKPQLIKAVQGAAELSIEEAHVRYGHVNIKTVCKILGLPPPDHNTPKIECESCEVEKQRKQALPDKAQSRASRPLYRLHIDSSGKKSATEGGNHYFIVVVDDNSRKGWVLLTPAKSDIPSKITTLLKQLQAQHPARKLAFIRLDGAKEYTQQIFKKSITDMGCTFEVSAPYRQAQNGVAEARIGLVWKMAMALINHSAPDHPRSDWGYAVKHANLIINTIPSDANGGLSPDEVWGDARSKLAIPGPLFCLCFAKVYVRGKMEPEAIKCVYMGNSEEHKAFLVRPIEGVDRGVLTSRDVTFFASQMPYRHPTVQRPIHSADDEPLVESDIERESDKHQGLPAPPVLDQDQSAEDEDEPSSEVAVEPQGDILAPSEVPRGYSQGSTVFVVDQHERTKQWRVYQVTVDSVRKDGVWIRFRGKSEAFGGYTPDVDVFRSRTAAEKLLASQEKANPIIDKGSIFATVSDEDKKRISSFLETDPRTRAEMLKHPHRDGYTQAEILEMEQLYSMKVYELVERHESMNVLGSRWVYKAKRDLISGEISKFRARLVAKGFKERYGMEYWETFSSNIKLEDARLMLALATYYDFPLWHFDIKAYFLYGKMDEDVYMDQAEGYHEGPPRGQVGAKVYRLLKAIYGTKQAQRCADKELKSAWADVGVFPIMSDNSMYYARDGDKIFICGMYVDDGLCFGNDDNFVQEKLDGIRRAFDIIVIKDPKVFVGIQIERDRTKGTMLLHQEGAIMKLLGGTGMVDCKPVKTPMRSGIVLNNPSDIDMTSMSTEIKEFPYQSLVGQLLWLLGTRIDLCFTINVLSRYMSKWDEVAITMLKRALRYLKGKEKYGLVYLRGPRDAKLEIADSEPTKIGFLADADHASRIYDSKTTGAHVGQHNGNTIIYGTKAHTVGISTSSGQAEALTCKLACHVIEWCSGLAKELKIRGHGPIVLQQDNQSVISLSANPVNHKRSKHYRVAMAYVRDLVERLVVSLEYCPTEEMIADVLTKPLAEAQHWHLLKLARFGKVEWFAV